MTANAHVAYEDDGTFATAFNVKYMIIPGFAITPEVNYTPFGGERRLRSSDGTDAFQEPSTHRSFELSEQLRSCERSQFYIIPVMALDAQPARGEVNVCRF